MVRTRSYSLGQILGPAKANAELISNIIPKTVNQIPRKCNDQMEQLPSQCWAKVKSNKSNEIIVELILCGPLLDPYEVNGSYRFTTTM